MNSQFPEPKFVAAGDISIAVYEKGEGPPVIMVHGFPELAYSWRHQLPALADAGYRAIAVDMRGYGATDKPDDVAAYSIDKLTGDVDVVLEKLGIEKAVVVGHDWGAIVTWQMALLKPQRMAGLIALNIPHIPRPPINPITYMRFKLGKNFYIVNFQDSDEADRRFAEDPAKFINVMMRRRQFEQPDALPAKRRKRRAFSLLEELERETPRGVALLDDSELDYYATAFAQGGFTGPINWYRNFKHNWKITKGVKQTVKVPALFVRAADDRLISTRQVDAMRPYVEDLEIQTIESCGHWTQQECPDDLHRIMLDWLGRRYDDQ